MIEFQYFHDMFDCKFIRHILDNRALMSRPYFSACAKDRSEFKDKEETSVDIDLRIILRSLGEEGNISNLLDLVSRGSKK